uniref:Ig-like domain-containing protein n=1 Tax=Glossina austeni TaxID=7395 RepID=A0A1A9UI27_GLOAU
MSSWRFQLKPVGIYAKKYEWAARPSTPSGGSLHLDLHPPPMQIGGDCSLWIRSATLDFDDGLWECQVTASDFTTQDALTSQPVRLVVRVRTINLVEIATNPMSHLCIVNYSVTSEPFCQVYKEKIIWKSNEQVTSERLEMDWSNPDVIICNWCCSWARINNKFTFTPIYTLIMTLEEKKILVAQHLLQPLNYGHSDKLYFIGVFYRIPPLFFHFIAVAPQRPRLEYEGTHVPPGHNITVDSGSLATAKCVSHYGNPPATLKWFLGDQEIEPIHLQTNITEPDNPRTWSATSVVQLTAMRERHGDILRCLAFHESYTAKSVPVEARFMNHIADEIIILKVTDLLLCSSPQLLIILYEPTTRYCCRTLNTD